MSRMHEEAQTGFLATFRPLHDDRSRPIRRIRRSDITRAAGSENVGIRHIAVRLKHAIKSESRRITADRIALTVAAVLLVIITTAIFNALLLPVLGLSGRGLGVLTFIGFIVLAHIGIMRFIRRGTLNQLARTAVAEGVCGSCAFPLEQVPVEPDGCVICPECGSAWKHERIVQPFWVSPPKNLLRKGFIPAIMPGVLPVASLFAPDDRGRFVQTPDSRLMRLLPETRAKIPTKEFRKIRRRTRLAGVWWRGVLTLCLVGFPYLIFWGAWSLYHDERWSEFWVVLALGVVVATPVLLIPFGAAFSTPHKTSRAIVRLGRCGSCMEPLADTPPDHTGRVTCRECGSCWLSIPARSH